MKKVKCFVFRLCRCAETLGEINGLTEKVEHLKPVSYFYDKSWILSGQMDISCVRANVTSTFSILSDHNTSFIILMYLLILKELTELILFRNNLWSL